MIFCLWLFLFGEPTAVATPTATTLAEAAPAGRLVVRATAAGTGKSAKRSGGLGAFALYDSADTFNARTPLRAATREMRDGISEWIVDDLPAGDYAIAFYQDRNENAELDRNKLGVPKEPYGFSQDARAAFGPPSFAAARFSFDGSTLTITLDAY